MNCIELSLCGCWTDLTPFARLHVASATFTNIRLLYSNSEVSVHQTVLPTNWEAVSILYSALQWTYRQSTTNNERDDAELMKIFYLFRLYIPLSPLWTITCML